VIKVTGGKTFSGASLVLDTARVTESLTLVQSGPPSTPNLLTTERHRPRTIRPRASII